MSLCINPNCRNPDTLANQNNMFCQDCGSDLLIHGCYRVVRLIGEGGFAKTYEVLERGTSRVLKMLLPCHTSNQKAVELFQQEASILSRLNHSGVPKITSKGCFTFAPRDQQIKHIHCFVMERIAGVDLEMWMENRKGNVITLDLALNWLQQLVKILDLIHQQQYFHRDIKPSNIMLRPNGQLVLIDFGAAREMTNTYMAKMVRGSVLTSIGSAGYIPPEQANGKGVPQSDFFSLGRTFVYLLTGQTPSNFPESPTTGQMIWHSSAPKISSLLLGFVDQLMSPFVGNRPKNAQEILQKLKQIEVDVQKTISVNKIGAVRQSSQKSLNLKYSLWAIPITSLAVMGYIFSNSLTGRGAKSLQVTEPELSPSIPVSSPISQPISTTTKAPESKPEVKTKAIDIKPSVKPSPDKTQQENNRLAEEKKRRKELLLRQEQEKVAARQRAIEREQEIASQRQYEAARQSAPPRQESPVNVYDDVKEAAAIPVKISPVESSGNQQVSTSGAAAPWEGATQKSRVDEIADVIKETEK